MLDGKCPGLILVPVVLSALLGCSVSLGGDTERVERGKAEFARPDEGSLGPLSDVTLDAVDALGLGIAHRTERIGVRSQRVAADGSVTYRYSTRLKIALGNVVDGALQPVLREEQVVGLRRLYTEAFGFNRVTFPWLMALDPPHSYHLTDFLPPMVQATDGLLFAPEMHRDGQGAPTIELSTNCWGTVYELLRNDRASLALFHAAGAGVDRYLASDAYSTRLGEATHRQGLLSQLIETSVQPGDYLIIRRFLQQHPDPERQWLEAATSQPEAAVEHLFAPVTDERILREGEIVHALVFVDKRIVFEKTGTKAHFPYRLETTDMALAGYRDMTAHTGDAVVRFLASFELRRPLRDGTPLPPPEQAFRPDSIVYGGSSFFRTIPYEFDRLGFANIREEDFRASIVELIDEVGQPDRLVRLPSVEGALAVFDSAGESYWLACQALLDVWDAPVVSISDSDQLPLRWRHPIVATLRCPGAGAERIRTFDGGDRGKLLLVHHDDGRCYRHWTSNSELIDALALGPDDQVQGETEEQIARSCPRLGIRFR